MRGEQGFQRTARQGGSTWEVRLVLYAFAIEGMDIGLTFILRNCFCAARAGSWKHDGEKTNRVILANALFLMPFQDYEAPKA